MQKYNCYGLCDTLKHCQAIKIHDIYAAKIIPKNA